jgi:hypothetical protein
MDVGIIGHNDASSCLLLNVDKGGCLLRIAFGKLGRHNVFDMLGGNVGDL